MKKVIALGFFDSLHIGHRKLIAQAQQLAEALDAAVCVSTFDDAFFDRLCGGKEKIIFSLDERKKILADIGIFCIKVLESTKERFLQDGKEFFDELTCGGDIAAIVCGEDYTFGKDAAYNARDLATMCQAKGISLHIAPTVLHEGQKVSSSTIRKLLGTGDMVGAQALLGRMYFCAGQVVRGRGDGKKLGAPTANLDIIKQKLLPAYGVYKTITETEGASYPSLTNVGGQPTFDIEKPTIETLLLGFDGNLYGKQITVSFVRRIRDIRKFADASHLRVQIQKDIQEVSND